MNAFFIHAVKAGLFMAIFYTVYYLFLSRDTAYLRNRIYLLASVPVSWLLPFLKLPTKSPVVNVEVLQWVITEVLGQAETQGSEVVVSGQGSFDLLTIVSLVYIAGIIFFTARFISGIAGIVRLIIAGSVNGKVVEVDNPGSFSGFSALGFIFINKSLPEPDKKKVLLHEEIHNKLLHYLDTILCEIAVTLQWMNPFAYLFRYSLRAVHEYHTDREYIQKTGKIGDYQMLIFNQIFGTGNIPVASCFSAKSLIKKRIIMMTQKETRKGAAFKILIAVPVIAAAVLVFSCQDIIEEVTREYVETEAAVTESVTLDPVTVVAFAEKDTTAPATSVVVDQGIEMRRDEVVSPEYGDMIIIVDGVERDQKYLAQIPDSEIAALRILRPETAMRTYGSRGAAGVAIVITNKHAEERQKESRDVFMIVENMPTFMDGDVQRFSNWVMQRIKYPKIAYDNGIQGKVFIGFVVEPDGSVSTVTVLRSVDKVLDDEAVRVVQSSPAWKPGTQKGVAVPVRFSITVNFQLQ